MERPVERSEEPEEGQRQDWGFIHTAAMIAAIILALASVMDDRGTGLGDGRLFQTVLFVAGFFAVIATQWSLFDMRERCNPHPPVGYGTIEVSLLITALTFVGIMIDLIA